MQTAFICPSQVKSCAIRKKRRQKATRELAGLNENTGSYDQGSVGASRPVPSLAPRTYSSTPFCRSQTCMITRYARRIGSLTRIERRSEANATPGWRALWHLSNETKQYWIKSGMPHMSSACRKYPAHPFRAMPSGLHRPFRTGAARISSQHQNAGTTCQHGAAVINKLAGD